MNTLAAISVILVFSVVIAVFVLSNIGDGTGR